MNAKRVATRSLVAAGITMVVLLLAACPREVTVGEILADPGRFYNKDVAVTGRVTQSYGALGTGVYEVDDGTGKIWVLSQKYGVPSKDAEVRLAGKVQPGVTVRGKSYATAIIEKGRRARY